MKLPQYIIDATDRLTTLQQVTTYCRFLATQGHLSRSTLIAYCTEILADYDHYISMASRRDYIIHHILSTPVQPTREELLKPDSYKKSMPKWLQEIASNLGRSVNQVADTYGAARRICTSSDYSPMTKFQYASFLLRFASPENNSIRDEVLNMMIPDEADEVITTQAYYNRHSKQNSRLKPTMKKRRQEKTVPNPVVKKNLGTTQRSTSSFSEAIDLCWDICNRGKQLAAVTKYNYCNAVLKPYDSEIAGSRSNYILTNLLSRAEEGEVRNRHAQYSRRYAEKCLEKNTAPKQKVSQVAKKKPQRHQAASIQKPDITLDQAVQVIRDSLGPDVELYIHIKV